MTPYTWHAVYTACAADDLSHVTDGQTDTVDIGKNGQHLMHSLQPKNYITHSATTTNN